MILHRFLLTFAFYAATPAWARLGEAEAQSQARYGAPTPELSAPNDKPLLPGAKEVIYNFSGYRVRAAFVNNVTVRIEYAHLPENGALKQLTDSEIKVILEAEKATYSWKEEKPKTGNKGLDALQTFAEGRKWERNDHARATLKLNLLLELEARDADSIEKKLARQLIPAKPGATPIVPKF